jgi:hypothetical protein
MAFPGFQLFSLALSGAKSVRTPLCTDAFERLPGVNRVLLHRTGHDTITEKFNEVSPVTPTFVDEVQTPVVRRPVTSVVVDDLDFSIRTNCEGENITVKSVVVSKAADTFLNCGCGHAATNIESMSSLAKGRV